MATSADNEIFKQQIDVLLLPYPIYREYVASETHCYSLIAEHYSLGGCKFILSGSFKDGFPEVIDQSDVDYLWLLYQTGPPVSRKWHENWFTYLDNAPAHFHFSLKPKEADLFAKDYPEIFSEIFTNQSDGILYLSAEKTRYLAKHDIDIGTRMVAGASAIQFEETNHISPAIGMRSGQATLDNVPCLKCEGWPMIAKEWKDRPRTWPEDELFRKIKNKGFFIVPKPSNSTGDIKKEWRILFSEIEADLLQSLNVVESKVYYILRCFYVRYLKGQLKDMMSSYHLKTAMFWALENSDRTEWKEENISSLVRKIMEQLIRWYSDQFLPHYFIREHNLLYDLPSSSIERVLNVFQTFACHISQIIDQSVINSRFIGLLPRSGILAVQINTKLNVNILRRSSNDAYKLLTEDRDSRLAKHIEYNCQLAVLNEFKLCLIHSPDTEFVAQIYAPCLLMGVEFLDGSSNMAVFMEVTLNQINAATRTITFLCFHILSNQIHGYKRILSFLAKLTSILDEAYLSPIFNAIIDAITRFMITARGPPDLHCASLSEAVDNMLVEYDDILGYKDPSEEHIITFPLSHIFVLSGGLCCRLAKLHSDS